MTRKELENILYTDLGLTFDPQRSLEFLRILETKEKPTPAAKRLTKLLENPPEEDTTLLVIYKTQYVLGEVVLAGRKTQETYVTTKFHPIHFKKTYLQKFSRWETSPQHEAQMSHLVWKHFESKYAQPPQQSGIGPSYPNVPRPLGADATTYRSEILEAKTLGALSPVSSTQDAKHIALQIKWAIKNFGDIKPLWRGLEELYKETQYLHNGGFLHKDLHRENLLIRYGLAKTNPIVTGCLIDFETTIEDPRFQTPDWNHACKEDSRQLIEEACLIRLCVKDIEATLSPWKTSPLLTEVEKTLQSSPKMLSIQKELKNK